MKTNQGEIISLYREADINDRLSIFLQFRELRNEFLEIEQKERQPKQLSGCRNVGTIFLENFDAETRA